MTTTLPPTDRHTIRLPIIATGPVRPTPQPPPPDDSARALLAAILLTRPPQERPLMLWHDVVAAVAQAHCVDMVERDFFNHTNPDGVGANDRLRAAGLELPAYYSDAPDANNVESLAMGQQTAQEAWDALIRSGGHRVHLLGENDFYREQWAYGIGYYRARWAVVITKLEMESGE